MVCVGLVSREQREEQHAALLTVLLRIMADQMEVSSNRYTLLFPTVYPSRAPYLEQVVNIVGRIWFLLLTGLINGAGSNFESVCCRHVSVCDHRPTTKKDLFEGRKFYRILPYLFVYYCVW